MLGPIAARENNKDKACPHCWHKDDRVRSHMIHLYLKVTVKLFIVCGWFISLLRIGSQLKALNGSNAANSCPLGVFF